jgi:hypothetical protein
MTKRECVILVADGQMAAAFRGYFGRHQWHQSIGCASFDFNPDIGGDLIVDEGGNDPGVYTKGHELLRPFLKTHKRAVVVLDCEWGGSPGKAQIEQDIADNLANSGWHKNAVRVIAIDPELENWFWQDNPHVADALRYKGQPPLRQWLEQNGLWPQGMPKPPKPKEAVEWALKQTKKPRSAAIYQQLASRIGIHGCTDQAFLDLHHTLKSWFPNEMPT